MMVLKSCKGQVCTEPWAELHPQGDVNNLIDSLDERFDAFYQEQPKVSFSECRLGYFPEVEGPMDANRFMESQRDGSNSWFMDELRKRDDLEDRGPWHVWT